MLLLRMAPFGLFAVLILLATGVLWPFIVGPVEAIVGLLATAFGLQFR